MLFPCVEQYCSAFLNALYLFRNHFAIIHIAYLHGMLFKEANKNGSSSGK